MEHIPEEELVDPVQGLSWLKQIETNETIVNSVRTPFDYARYCQVVRNPLNQDELITVQIVKQNVFHSAVSKGVTLPNRMHCEKGSPMELIEKVITEAKHCDMCGIRFLLGSK